MANNNSAITAIRNIRQESFVAANLDLIGWTLIFRATDKEGLLVAARSHPTALIIAGDDFSIDGIAFPNPVIEIKSKEVLEGNQLQDLLRRVNESDTPKPLSIPLCSSEVTVVSTVNSGLGGTTCAIEIAYEKSRLGKSTLLFDFNPSNPTLSRHFDIQRINRKVVPSSLGFSLAEVSELSHILAITQEANAFDEVVIDLGRIPSSEHLVSGVRIHEVLARWSLQSASRFLLISGSDDGSLQNLARVTSQLERTSSFIKPIAILLSHHTVTGRERRETLESAAALYNGDVRFLPWDPRLVERAAKERVPIAQIAPKSPYVQEIASICKREVKRGR